MLTNLWMLYVVRPCHYYYSIVQPRSYVSLHCTIDSNYAILFNAIISLWFIYATSMLVNWSLRHVLFAPPQVCGILYFVPWPVWVNSKYFFHPSFFGLPVLRSIGSSLKYVMISRALWSDLTILTTLQPNHLLSLKGL